ncbi:DNA translocase FtsK [Bacillus aquiflavi]|uniref:DNA translocase FtsK n=1 Tax=Bacillus aquiflavi TaxID=2672567 RepID=UPI001CA952E5|nr:DNA translocase FtsK [Bacillus aquiflavi]
MSWFKKLFQRFMDDGDHEANNMNNHNGESDTYKQSHYKSKEIDARIMYQYPKGNFRFPIKLDEAQGSERRIQSASILKEENNEETISIKRNEPDQKIISKKIRSPFRPTEIPSPIHGFERPKEKKKIEYELTSFQSFEEQTNMKSREEVQKDQTASISQQQNVNKKHDSDIKQSDFIEQTLPIEDEQSKENLKLSQSQIKLEKKQEKSVTRNQETIKGRSHLPFNVIMLKQDKRRLEERKKRRSEEQRINNNISERKQNSANHFVHHEVSEGYEFPYVHFLHPPILNKPDANWLNEQGELLNETLKNFNVSAKVVNVTQGPSVTQFEVQPDIGVKVNKITNLADDIKLSLAARDIRIEAPIPGKHTVGIEVPNKNSRPVLISEVINSSEFRNFSSPLAVVLGLDISGKPVVADLIKMPHGLIAGATGSGKSVCINTMLISLLYKADPNELKLLLIDPKMVELAPYNRIPHLISPVITNVKAATAALKWAVEEMERRYKLCAHEGVRDISRFNAEAENKLPYIVIVIDELADLMMMSPADVEEAICRIAQKARAAGIHLMIATQRPSVDVITGLIKANIPTRIAFSVSSQVDSRTIIDMSGAERLLGRGDMLYMGNGLGKPVRLQGTFVSDEEIDQVVAHVRNQQKPNYLFEQEELLKKSQIADEEDELFFEACEFIVNQGGASASSLQRRFRIGYNRAARLIDLMEQQGIISEAKGSKPRDVLISESDLESI